VGTGQVQVNGTTYTYTGTGSPFTIGAASTSDRRDTVVYTVGTGVQVIAGGPCGYTSGIWTHSVTTNNPPVKQYIVGSNAVPANSVILAEVYVSLSTTTIITATNIVDKRLVILPYFGANSSTAEIGGTKGASSVAEGVLVSSTRYGAVDMVVGDSIGRGYGGTFGVTDWATLLATGENYVNGQAAPGVGFKPAYNTNDAYGWSNTTNGSVPGSTLLQGPSTEQGSLYLASSGKSISDTLNFRRIKVYYQTTYNGDGLLLAVTGGSAPSATVDTHSAATGVSSSGSTLTVTAFVGAAPQVGDAVQVQAGTGAWTTTPTVQSVSGTTVVVSGAPSTGLSGATISFSGYRLWDSTDLGSLAGTAITATWATHVTGSG
jgi:hypothetical protein